MGAPSLWTERTLRPRGNSSLVFLADALEEVGKGLMGNTWSGSEPSDALIGPPPLTEAVGRYYQAKWGDYNQQGKPSGTKLDYVNPKMVESWERLSLAMAWIAVQGAESDALVTKGRKTTGGDYFELPPWFWNIEELWFSRFQECRAVHDGQPTYIFITRKSLDRCLRRASRQIPENARKAHPSSLAEGDAALVEEMHGLITSGEVSGPYPAALRVVDKAKGGGTTMSKVRRLTGRYQQQFGG